MLLLHIVSALAGIFFSGIAYFAPSKTKLNVANLFSFVTIVTGTVLTVFEQVNIAKVCVAGLFYLGVVFYLLMSAQKKLTLQHNKQ